MQDELNGPLVLIDESGDVKQECYYEKNLLEQKLKIYISNKLYMETAYLNGNKQGAQIIYNEKNQLIANLNYEKNKLDGKASWYDDDGKLIKISYYAQNQLHGLTYIYNNGQKSQKILFKEGTLVRQLNYANFRTSSEKT